MEANNGQTDATPQRILIVDDLPANLSVLLSFLEDAGYEVLVAESGEGALARLTYMQPDIILLDINMPGLDGYETCRRLKTESRWQDTPVLFLTALSDAVDKVRGFEVGAVDYITKPLHNEEVLARVRAHLRIRSLQQALEEKNELLENAMARRLEAETQLQQSLDRAVLLVNAEGDIQFCTLLARRLLERYFSGHDDAVSLPAPLAKWARAGSSAGPWRAESTEGRLEVHFFTPGHQGVYRMLLFDEKLHVTNSPARLLNLGLTAREAEVLFYWAAHGKSNGEVALILNASLNTIKKHIANILIKTGAETRLIAALQAAELLELGTHEPNSRHTNSQTGTR